jgi:hypothetical protein
MDETRILGSMIAGTRRWGALGLFRLARCVLRGAIGLGKRPMIPRVSVQAALSVGGLLEKSAAVLLLGPRRSRHQHDSNEEY